MSRARSRDFGERVNVNNVNPVLLIDQDNTTLHVGPPDVIIDHLLQARAEVGRAAHDRLDASESPWQLYDRDGQNLMLESHLDQPRSTALIAGVSSESEEVLLARINMALDHLQQLLDAKPGLGAVGPEAPRETEVPRPTGSYAEVLAALSEAFAFDDPGPRDKGNFFHMLAHAAGLAHR